MSDAASPQLAVPARLPPVPFGLLHILGTPKQPLSFHGIGAENDETRALEAFPAGGNLVRGSGGGGPRVAFKVGGSSASWKPAQWVEQGARGQRPQTPPLPPRLPPTMEAVQLAMQPLPPPPRQPAAKVQGAGGGVLV